MNNCVFCEIVAKRRDSELTVFENEYLISQVSLRQKSGNRGHLLVLPKKHIPTIYELTQELEAPLMSALRLLARATQSAYNAEGIHIRQNNGAAAGQDVFHLHFHVIPRYENDNFETQHYEIVELWERRQLAEKLKASIRSLS